MAHAFAGILGSNQRHAARFVEDLRSGRPGLVGHTAQLGGYHAFVLFDGDPADLAMSEAGCLLLDRPVTGGTTASASGRRRPAASGLLGHRAEDLARVLQDPVSFVKLGRDGAVELFRGLYSGRPLFFAVANGSVCFATHLQLLQRHIQGTSVNSAALAEYLQMRWMAGQDSLVDGIKQVLPGQLVTIDPTGSVATRFVVRPRYASEPVLRRYDEAVAATEKAIREELSILSATHRKAVVTLSAGVDSSLILALAREVFPEVVAVTADWEGPGNPEIDQARAIAAHLGVRHVAAVLRDEDLPEIWATVVDLIGSGPRRLSSLALLACFRQAAEEGSVLLYGGVADNLYGSGQIGWLTLEQQRRARLQRLPTSIRAMLGGGARTIGGRRGRLVTHLLNHTESQLHALDVTIEYRQPPKQYFVGYPPSPDVPAGWDFDQPEHLRLQSQNRVQDYLLRITIPDHLLMISRIADAAGIEMVNVFTTPSVLAVAESLHHSLLFRDGVSKPILRDLAGRYVGAEVIEAPKMGFPTPNGHWLEAGLRREVEQLHRAVSDRSAAWFLKPRLASTTIQQDVEAWWTALGLATVFSTLGVSRIGPSVHSEG